MVEDGSSSKGTVGPAYPNSHQLDTLRLYARLIGEREDWGGGMVLSCGEGCVANGLPVAVSIASGATLAIDGDADGLKDAMRKGELDFVVNTLDEALRALKNEVRQRRPLSVGLIAEMEPALKEVVERGVLPDMLLVGMDQPSQPIVGNGSVRALEALGMPLRLAGGPDIQRPYRPMVVLGRKRHYEFYLPAVDALRLRELDQQLLAVFPAEEFVRRRWIERVPKYLRDARNGGRWVWLSEEDVEQLKASGISPEQWT